MASGWCHIWCDKTCPEILFHTCWWTATQQSLLGADLACMELTLEHTRRTECQSFTHTHTLTGNSAPSSAQVKQTDLRQLDGRHRHTLMTSNVTAVPTIKSIIETYVLMNGQRSQFHMYLFSWVCIGSCESFCLREGGKKEKEEKKKNKAIKMSIS